MNKCWVVYYNEGAIRYNEILSIHSQLADAEEMVFALTQEYEHHKFAEEVNLWGSNIETAMFLVDTAFRYNYNIKEYALF